PSPVTGTKTPAGAIRRALRCVASAPDQAPRAAWCFLSGPEGGLSETEEELARQQGWSPVSLGTRVLRADTAPLTVMSLMALHHRPTSD
ncbi:MAG: RsmE family RNA methyltransferase, partial [Rubrivivax sp.]